jgi:hypothetical protein
MTAVLALVESPSQLLNVVEWSHRFARDRVAVAVLPARDTATRTQLSAMSEIARACGLGVTTYDVRAGVLGLATRGGALLPHLIAARQLLVGDPFSRAIQTLLQISPANRIVVVDDGTATLEYAVCVDDRRPLVRWWHTGRVPVTAQRATRRLSPGSGHELAVFSAMAGGAPAGALALHNEFSWTRASYRPRVLIDSVDIAGASLVESGLVDRESYIAAVVQIARRHGATRYLAHRREDDAKLVEIACRSGLAVHRPDLPLELFLRQGPVGATVVTLPSTVAHTLPIVLADTGVAVCVHDVDPSWFLPTASPHARQFLRRVASEARTRHALQRA